MRGKTPKSPSRKQSHNRKSTKPRAFSELPKTGFVRAFQLVSDGVNPGILPFSLATLYRKVSDGTFPAPIKLSANITAWRAEDVRAWLDEKGKQHQEPESQAA